MNSDLKKVVFIVVIMHRKPIVDLCKIFVVSAVYIYIHI